MPTVDASFFELGNEQPFMHDQLPPPVTIGIPVYIGAATFATAFETLAAYNNAIPEIVDLGKAYGKGRAHRGSASSMPVAIFLFA